MKKIQVKTERNEKITQEYRDKVLTGTIQARQLCAKYQISESRLYQIVKRQREKEEQTIQGGMTL